MPLLMRESELARLIRTAGVSSRSEDESRVTGHPVSGGCVEGEVVVVRDPGDFHRMKNGGQLLEEIAARRARFEAMLAHCRGRAGV